MELSKELVEEINKAWEIGLNNPTATCIVVPVEALKAIPQIAEYNGDKIIVLIPQSKNNIEFLTGLKEFIREHNDN